MGFHLFIYIEAVVLGLCGCFVLCEFHSRRWNVKCYNFIRAFNL